MSVAGQPASILGDLALNLAIAASYWLVAEMTLVPATSQGRITPIWPPAGLALAAMLLGGARVLPGVALGAFIVTARHMPLLSAGPVAIGMVLQVVVNTRLLRRFEFDARLERVRDPLVLCAVTIVGALVAGLFGMLAVVVGGRPLSDWSGFHVWWLRDWLGSVLVASLVLTWARSRRVIWTWPRIVEAVTLGAALVVSTNIALALWEGVPERRVPLAFVFFPILGYTGLRFGPAGASSLIAVIAAFAVPLAARGTGPFAGLALGLTMFLLHSFLLLGWLSAQILAAVRAEWEDALARRLALEEQLRHSQKMEAIGRLAGGIAHDFNNLLTAILGYAELVTVSLRPGDPLRADAEQISRAATRAAELTGQMLAFSRRQVLQPKVIDLNVTLANLEPLLVRVIGKDIVLSVRPRAAIAPVRVDPGQIEHVIINLVTNARDALLTGGRITIETDDVVIAAGDGSAGDRPGRYVRLAVSDTGTGMTNDVQARVFEPYFTTKEMGKGTGLGLSIAYGIVQESDGHIELLSAPGQGTVVRVYLPLVQNVPLTHEVVAREEMVGGTAHILLIENDASVRRLVREILTRLGYSVTEAESGHAGMSLAGDETKPIDLVICDVILGDMSGPAAITAIHAVRPDIPVLYMSGRADEAAMRANVKDASFLQKPFAARDLAEKVREVLDGVEIDDDSSLLRPEWPNPERGVPDRWSEQHLQHRR